MPLLGDGLHDCNARMPADGLRVDLTVAARRHEHYGDVEAETIPLIKVDVLAFADILLQGCLDARVHCPEPCGAEPNKQLQ